MNKRLGWVFRDGPDCTRVADVEDVDIVIDDKNDYGA